MVLKIEVDTVFYRTEATPGRELTAAISILGNDLFVRMARIGR